MELPSASDNGGQIQGAEERRIAIEPLWNPILKGPGPIMPSSPASLIDMVLEDKDPSSSLQKGSTTASSAGPDKTL
jgi:hypothetical protein